MTTTTAAVTSTMQIVKYHVKYSTITAQNPPEATTVVVVVKVNLKKVTIIVTSTTKSI